MRLNRLGDEGGVQICNGLEHNYTLESCILSNNELAVETAQQLSLKVLKNKKSKIVKLDLSGNQFTQAGGKALIQGILENHNIKEFDVRRCSLSSLQQKIIAEKIKINLEVMSGKRELPNPEELKTLFNIEEEPQSVEQQEEEITKNIPPQIEKIITDIRSASRQSVEDGTGYTENISIEEKLL